MYSPIARSVVLKRKDWTTLERLGNVFIHIAARSRLSLQMAEPREELIHTTFVWVGTTIKTNLLKVI